MFPTVARRLAAEVRPKLTIFNNPYKTKKVWPPDFSKLNTQEQLRFEKKYKRRLGVASARPRWNKAIKLIQLFSVVGFILWTFAFSELEFWGKEYRPSEEVRKGVLTLFGSIDPDKRFERRRDAPPAPSTQPETKST